MKINLRFEKSTGTVRTVPENYCVMSTKTFADGGSMDAAIKEPEKLANLFATAPELYELLDQINAAFYTRTSRKEWIELMNKTKPLLQKARGES